MSILAWLDRIADAVTARVPSPVLEWTGYLIVVAGLLVSALFAGLFGQG